MRSLISAFVIPYLESIISKLATTRNFNVLAIVSVAEETGLSTALSETPEDRVCNVNAQMIHM